MARSLEGARFYYNSNNGVHALTSEDVERARDQCFKITTALTKSIPNHHYSEIEKVQRQVQRGMERHFFPVFTFVPFKRLEEEPIYTGSYTLLKELKHYILTSGGHMKKGGFYVPFSNGPLNHDYRYVTTDGEFEAVFGIMKEALLPDGSEQPGRVESVFF